LKVLVTGGCGYIGSRLIPFLLADGHTVTCVDTQWFGEGAMSDNGNLTVVKGDVRELGIVECDAVIHLASISQNDMYAVNPSLCGGVNRWIPNFPVKRLIYASSVAAYGTSDDLLTEDSPLKPTTPYGRDKALCEEGVLSVGGVVVRSASVCGHSPNMRFDTPVNSMTRDALNGLPIRVNGGKQIRCQVHIDDLCDFYRRVLQAPTEKIAGQSFNVVRTNESIEATAYLVRNSLAEGFLKPERDESKWAKIEWRESSDERSYMVMKHGKVIDVLNWTPSRTISSAIVEMKAHFDSGNPQYKDFSPARMRML
jgi:nucleoside-diphosphate-sugar epimerase